MRRTYRIRKLLLIFRAFVGSLGSFGGYYREGLKGKKGIEIFKEKKSV